jgi:hypothetical protein
MKNVTVIKATTVEHKEGTNPKPGVDIRAAKYYIGLAESDISFCSFVRVQYNQYRSYKFLITSSFLSFFSNVDRTFLLQLE